MCAAKIRNKSERKNNKMKMAFHKTLLVLSVLVQASQAQFKMGDTGEIEEVNRGD